MILQAVSGGDGEKASPDEILNSFLDYIGSLGVDLYDHQEEAILELLEGKNVILNTPTGSGKSMVALALQYRALCLGRRCYYTVPIKALANEKFLSLCKVFGPDNVGMITGDATVNASAQIICCTAEILSNLALREGSRSLVDDVIMDEFHYYSDHERGGAWQIPLLTLPQARFCLMSATLGETDFFRKELTSLTGVETVLVKSDTRPIPLNFSYSEISLTEKIAELVEQDRAPIYLVNFTQRACAEVSQDLLSSNFSSKEEKKQISEILQDANFRSPYGKEVNKLLRHGIGIHHAGLLPKYRILVENLAQKGLLKVICGTDTLGVGVNVPIRTVLFTQLCKYDGKGTSILTVRDFKQISGRAGRRGFDDAGYVVAQAPAHVIENIRLEAKAAGKAKKGKVVKKKPPEKGFVNWDEETFRKLIHSNPEKLTSSFKVTHSMLLNVLSRDGEDGCEEMRRLIRCCHESPGSKRKLRKQAWKIFRGLLKANILSIIPLEERSSGAKVRLNIELQEDFSLNHALGLYLIHTVGLLDSDVSEQSLQVLSLVESVLEDPIAVLRQQMNKLKGEMILQMKEEGVEYEERMERLEEVEWPKPGKDFIYDTFNRFKDENPWIADGNVKPKSIAREMVENFQSFEDYVKIYGLERSEAVLLRHLSETYKVLTQTVPDAVKTEGIQEIEEFLEEALRVVDSSLIDEWEKLRDPNYIPPDEREIDISEKEIPFTRKKNEFEKSVRSTVHRLMRALAVEDWVQLRSLILPDNGESLTWSDDALIAAVDSYYENHSLIRLDPEARNRKNMFIDQKDGRQWKIEQVLIDPDEKNDWMLRCEIDLDACDQESSVVVTFKGLSEVGTV